MNINLYGDDSKGLIKLDPRTKIFIFFASGIMSLSSYNDLIVLIYSFIICVIYALSGKVWTALKAFLLLGVVLFFRAAINNSTGASPVVILIASALSTLFLFSFPMIASVLLIIQTTRISHFLSAFQAMHLPVKVVAPLAVFFRFLPTVADEWNGIRKAMSFRGISLSLGQIILHPFRTIEYILVPMLFSSVSVMEELAAAAMARGLDVDIKRSSYEEVKLRVADYIVIFAFASMIVLSVILKLKAKGVIQ